MDNLFNSDGSSLALLDPELVLDDEEGLGALGAKKRRKLAKRVKAVTRRKLRAAARARRRKASGQFADIAAAKRRRKARKAKVGTRRKLKAAAKARKRTKTGRFADLMSLMALSSVSATRKRRKGARKAKRAKRAKRALGLGSIGKVRRSRKARKAGKRSKRHGRKARKSAGRLMGFGHLVDISESFGQAEVMASAPVVGFFQHLMTGPGLAGLGGVLVAPILKYGIKDLALGKLLKIGESPFVTVGAGLLTAVGMWELGRAFKSAAFAKIGAYYSLGRMLEDVLVNPLVIANVQKAIGLSGVGQVRLPEAQHLLGQVRLPESQALLGQTRVPESQELSQEIVTEEELLGQFEDEGEEDSDVF